MNANSIFLTIRKYVLLDDGMSCASIARVLFLDDDTIGTWRRKYLEDGIEGVGTFGHEGGPAG